VDAFLELLAPLLGHWRVLIAMSASLLLAVALAMAFTSFTGGYGIGLVLLGLGGGMLWDADASRAKSRKGSSPK